MVWKDFMGRVIQEGDDILVAPHSNILHTGFVLQIEGNTLKYSYNWFVNKIEFENVGYVQVPDHTVMDEFLVDNIYVLERK